MDRIKVFQIIVFCVFLIIILRLAYWQFFSSFKKENESILRESEIPASRGEIYAADGFPLAANEEAFLVYGKPHEINKSPQVTAKLLAPLLISEKYATLSAQISEDLIKQKEEAIKNEEEELLNKLNNKNLYWVQLARKVPRQVKGKIQELAIAGLGFERDEKRFYPEASMAAQLLGFVGFDKFGRDVGYNGIEGYWDSRLHGKNGRLGQEQDPFGLPILVGKYKPIPPKQGDSLYLSIDRTVQFIVEDKLKKAVEKYGAKDGTVIVAEPETGHILAMATYPNFNPAQRSEFEEKLYRNPAVSDTFEPGSIFKLITMSAALDLSQVEPNTRCPCTGPVTIDAYEISTWNKKYHPNSTMTEVIQNSDNVGMTYVADKLGVDKFYDYIAKFGFGKLTGIDLQSEDGGNIRAKQEWRNIDLATASFGQGIAVTPIQMVQAVSVIANGGKLVPMRLVVEIGEGEHKERVKPQGSKQVISAKTASQITEMMVNAVRMGEARFFAPKGYRIAGKTGTAQIPVAGHYDPDKTIASFVGFAPADDPKFVMMVRLSQPSSSPFGSETAAPTFFEIAKELFNYWSILSSD